MNVKKALINQHFLKKNFPRVAPGEDPANAVPAQL